MQLGVSWGCNWRSSLIFFPSAWIRRWTEIRWWMQVPWDTRWWGPDSAPALLLWWSCTFCVNTPHNPTAEQKGSHYCETLVYFYLFSDAQLIWSKCLLIIKLFAVTKGKKSQSILFLLNIQQIQNASEKILLPSFYYWHLTWIYYNADFELNQLMRSKRPVM